MNKVDSPRRFKGVHSDISISNDNASHDAKMADQASRVLRGLAKMSVSEKKTIQDIAIVAREAIEKLPHGDNNLFLNFDIHRKGHVTRQDFQNILLSKTTTSKSEVDSLTDAIDSKNTGVINYTNISESLLKIEKEKYLSSSASLPSPVTYQQSSDNEVSKAPDDTVSNVHNAAIRFEGENNVIKEIDGYERAYLLGLKYSKDLKEKFSSKTSSTEIIPQVHDCYKGPPVRYFVGHEGSKRNLESADFQTTLIPGNGNKTYFNCDESKGSEIKSSYRPLSSHVKLSEAISSDSKQHLVLYKGNNKVYHNYESNEFQKSFHAEELRSHVPERMRKRSASAPPSRSKSERPFEDGTQNSSLMAYIKGETKPKPAKIMQEKPAVKHSNQYSQLSSQNVKESLEESTDNIANDNRPKIPEFNKKHVLNSVLSQVGSYGALSVMQFRLSNRDVSNSGYLNNDEFRTALASSGVHLPKHEMDGLFENYSTNLTQPKNSTSLEFLSNKKALNIGEFMQVLKERSSAHVIAKNTIRSTPLAMEEKKIWKKVSNALREPVVSSKHSLDFFRDIQIANKNKVHPNKLHEELNFLGSKLSPQEFSNLLTSIKTDKEGYVDMNKFVKRIDESFQENNKSDSSGLTLVSDDNKVIQHIRNPSKKRHYKFHSNNSDSQTINETYSNKNTTSPHCVPSCLQISDGKEFVDERLKWTKLCNQIQDKKTSIAKAFQSEELYDKPMSPIKLRDTLYKIGVIVGDDDFKMLHSHAVSSSRNSTDDKGVTLNSLCESVGISVTKTDSKKQSTVLCCPTDTYADTGIFTSSRESLMYHPTYRSSFLTSSVDDTKLVKGNRKRKEDIESGCKYNASSQGVSSEDFWKFSHIPEANMQSYSVRKSTRTLADFQEERISTGRKRSSSAPPRNSKYQVYNKNTDTKVPARFASTPLANYIANQNSNADKNSVMSIDSTSSHASFLSQKTSENRENKYIPNNFADAKSGGIISVSPIKAKSKDRPQTGSIANSLNHEPLM